MVKGVRGLIRYCRSPRGRLIVNLVSGVLAVGVAVLAARHFAETGWPLAHADIRLLAAASGFFLLSYLFKVYGWHRLFAPNDRPRRLALAAAGGAATVGGAALPGRFDDVVRVAVVRRYSGVDCIPTVCFSLFMLGLLDTAALMPLASSAAATSDSSVAVRAGMGVVAGAGLASAILVVAIPRLAASGRLIRFRFARWIGDRVISPREAWKAWILVLASWMARAIGLFFLLGALSVSLSFPLAIAFLVAAAASAALPIAPAGAATQAGAGAAILIISGIPKGEAFAFAVAAQGLVIIVGAALVAAAAFWALVSKLRARRAVAFPAQ
jgi:uncharacterized membrane protein YbhN (UPF0104 family)